VTRGYALIAYHAVDAQCAITLTTDLKNRGINIWLDRFDMRPEDDWYGTYQSALSDYAVIIILLSPYFVESHFGRAIISKAQELQRPIVPIIVRPLNPEQYPARMDYNHFVSMEGWQSDLVYQSAVNRIFETIKSSKMVKMDSFIDPEIRHHNQLQAQVELHKALLEARIIKEKPDNLGNYPPRPHLELTWGMNALFLSRGVTLQEVVPIKDILQWSKNVERFVLLSTQGMGKTTTLMRIMSEHLRQIQQNPKYTPRPRWVNLSHWQEDLPFSAFLMQEWGLKSDPTNDLASGKLIVFIDGVESLGIHRNLRLASLREWLHGKKPPKYVIIACDTEDYSLEYRLELPVVSLESLRESRVRELANTYLGRKTQSFFEITNEHFIAKHWMSNTLYLRMAMFFFQQYPELPLPKNNEQLMFRVLELLWEQEQILKHPDWYPFEEVLESLAQIAFTIRERGLPHSITPEQTKQFISEGVLTALLSANILHLHGNRLQFFHHGVMDVLSGYYLQNETINNYLAYTEFDSSGRRIAHYWDDSIVALVGILDNAEPTLLHISEVDPYLAIEAMIERDLPEDFKVQIIENLMCYALAHNLVTKSATFELLQKLTADSAVSIVLTLMRQGSWDARETAHKFLLQLPFPIADDLEQGLMSWDGFRSDELGEYFKQIGAEAVAPLIKLTQSSSMQVRWGAIWGLGLIADPAASVAIVHALEDNDPNVRLQALQEMVNFPEPTAVTTLVRTLSEGDFTARKYATTALEKIGGAAEPHLVRLLESSDEKLKRFAIGVLGRLGNAEYIRPFLANDNIDLKGVAIIALGQLRDDQSVEMIANSLQDNRSPSWSKIPMSKFAQQALEIIGTENAMSWLKKLIKRNDTQSSAQDAKARLQNVSKREEAYELGDEATPAPEIDSDDPYIARLNQTGVITELNAILDDLVSENWDIQQEAEHRLREYAKENQGRYQPQLLQILEDKLYHEDETVRLAIIEAFAYVGDGTSIPSLKNLLRDASRQVKMMTIRVLGHIGDITALPSIMEIMQDSNSMVREAVVEVLGQFRRAEALPTLINALNDRDEFVRRRAVIAIGDIGDSTAVQNLLPLLEDLDYQLRWVTVEALGKIHTERAVPHLIPLLSSDYALPYDRANTLGKLVKIVLEKIGTTEALKAIEDWDNQL
jgi:HEAT repeat protein